MPLSKIHSTLTSDHILLDGTDSTGANANSNVLLDSSAANTDVGSLMSYEAGADDGSALLTNTHLADMVSPVRSAGRTITIPDVSEPILTDDDNNTSIFRSNSDVVPSTGTVQETLTTWVTVDTGVTGTRGQGNKDALVSHSSGVFTFSKTGHYLINYKLMIGAHTVTYAGGLLYGSVDGSTFNALGEGYASVSNTSGTYFNTASLSVIFKVTDTSTHKIKTQILASGTTVTFSGHSDLNQTHCVFQRIGDI